MTNMGASFERAVTTTLRAPAFKWRVAFSISLIRFVVDAAWWLVVVGLACGLEGASRAGNTAEAQTSLRPGLPDKPQFAACRPAAGRIFWFTRNTFCGSYFCLMATSRL